MILAWTLHSVADTAFSPRIGVIWTMQAQAGTHTSWSRIEGLLEMDNIYTYSVSTLEAGLLQRLLQLTWGI